MSGFTNAAPTDANTLLNRLFAVCAVGSAITLTVGYRMGGSQTAPLTVFIAACVGVIFFASCGIFAEHGVMLALQGELARAYGLMGRQDNQASQARRGEPSTVDRIALSLSVAVDRLLHGRGAAGRHAALLAAQIRQRQGEALRLSDRMRSDIAILQAASIEARATGREVSNWSLSLAAQAETACSETDALAREAASLTDAVRAVAVQAERAAGVATALSEATFTSQQQVGGMTAALTALSDALGKMAEAQPHASPELLAATEQAHVALNEMRREAIRLVRQADQMADAVQAQHDFGFALSHAASLQADAIESLCRHLSRTQDELTMLHAAVIDPPLTGAQLGSAVPAQRALERLPGYADAMAQILRGLPQGIGGTTEYSGRET